MLSARQSLSPEIVGRRNARAWRRRAPRAQRRVFGRGPLREVSRPQPAAAKISDDVKLFATTFAAGFVIVSIFIG
jgi:hypothetical protein